MTYDCSSSMFQKMPSTLRAEDGWFRRGVRALAANRDRLGELEELAYAIAKNPGAFQPADAKELADELGPSWDPAELSDLLQAVVTLDLTLHQFAGEDPGRWVADLVGLGFLDETDAKALVDGLIAMHARNHIRDRTDLGVLPAFESLGYTTEIRGGMYGGRPLRLTGICSVALQLDADGPTSYFQLNRYQLQGLIATLQEAEKDLDALERSLKVSHDAVAS